MRNRTIRRACIGLACLGALVGAAPAAHAGSVSYESDGTLVYQAGAGEDNLITLYASLNTPGRINIGDSTATSFSIPTDRCEDQSFNDLGIHCDTPARLRLELGDGVDRMDFGSDFPNIPTVVLGGEGNDFLDPADNAPTSLTLDGEGGNDELVTGDGSQTLIGGPGNDKLEPRSGDDLLQGGDGDDMLRPDGAQPQGTDVADGGPGFDQIDNDWSDVFGTHVPAVDVSLDGVANDGRPGENDNITNVERIDTYVGGAYRLTDGADTINLYGTANEGDSTIDARGGDDDVKGNNYSETIEGGPGNDRLEGGFNADTITGGPGRDAIFGDDTDSQCGLLQSCTVPFGNDTIDARDGEVDQIHCGVGEDRAVVDANDVVSDCEVVERGGGDNVDGAGCVVPRVKGLKKGAAKRRVRNAGCAVRVRRVRHRRVKRGRVIKASAKAGKTLAAGSVVTLTVSRGR